MRRRRVILVLALAALSGLMAAYSALRFMQQRPTRLVAQEASSSNPVVVASRDLQVGHIVRAEDLQMINWPGDQVPQGYMTDVQEAVERGLIVPVRANEPLLGSKLAERGIGGGLPVMIPKGMRALSIRVDEIVGVAGFVTPGTRVDVLLTVAPVGAREPETRVILQNVETLAAGQTIQRDEEGKPLTVTAITLLVTPEEAEQLASAANQGRIQLALRSWLDLDHVETEGTRVSAVMGTTPALPRRRVVRGNTESTQGILEFYRAGVRTLISY